MTIRVSDVAGMVAAVPGLVGHQPQRSIVAVMVAGTRVVCTMRADLNERGLAAQTVIAARRVKADSIVLVAYVQQISQHPASVAHDLAMAIENETMDDEVPVLVRHVAVVAQDVWAEVESLSGRLGEQHPRRELDEHPVTLQTAFDGRRVAASREALADSIRPGTDALPDGFGRGFRERMESMASWSEATVVDACQDTISEVINEQEERGCLSGPTLGELVATATHEASQAPFLAALTIEAAPLWLEVWSQAARVANGSAAVAPLWFAGLAGWLTGDGCLLNLAGDLIGNIDSDTFAARMIASISRFALPPDFWESYRSTLEHAA